MNILVENGELVEQTCGTNVAYVLNNNSAFLPTQYKVLLSQRDDLFVPCMRMLYNGHIQLYYIAKGLKSLSSLIPSMDENKFSTVVGNLFSSFLSIKKNGFLSAQHINTDFDRIYIDPSTYKVKMVYFPLSSPLFDDDAAVENKIRVDLVKLISQAESIKTDKTEKLALDLSNGMLSLEDLVHRIQGGKAPGQEKWSQECSLISINAPERVELKITKDSFVIGKNPNQVDGVLSFNKMISRVHCKIEKNGDHFVITDLQSANGTYVNRRRVGPNESCQIKNGDIVRLANSDFQVSIN